MTITDRHPDEGRWGLWADIAYKITTVDTHRGRRKL